MRSIAFVGHGTRYLLRLTFDLCDLAFSVFVLRVLMGVPNSRLSTIFSAKYQLTTIFLASSQVTTNFG